jgi:nitroreductase
LKKELSFFKTVEKRRSVRSFSKKPVEKSKIQKILRTAWMSPSAMGMQNFKIFVVEEQRKKEKLVKATYDQEYVNSNLVLIFCTDSKRIKFMGNRGKQLLSVQDATIAASYSQLAATALGLSSVWVGHFASYSQLAATALGLSSVWVGHFKEKAVAEIIKTKLRPVVILPIGYANEKPKAKKYQKMKDLIKKV